MGFGQRLAVGGAVVTRGGVGAAVVGTGGCVVGDGGAAVAGATVTEIDGSGVKDELGAGDVPALGAVGRPSRINRPNPTSAISAAMKNAASWTLDAVALGLPAEV